MKIEDTAKKHIMVNVNFPPVDFKVSLERKKKEKTPEMTEKEAGFEKTSLRFIFWHSNGSPCDY